MASRPDDTELTNNIEEGGAGGGVNIEEGERGGGNIEEGWRPKATPRRGWIGEGIEEGGAGRVNMKEGWDPRRPHEEGGAGRVLKREERGESTLKRDGLKNYYFCTCGAVCKVTGHSMYCTFT